MHFETAIVMIVGIVALVSLRLILVVVGKEYAADHPRVSIPRRDMVDASVPTTRVVRGTGRNSHLLYFPPQESSALPHGGYVNARTRPEPSQIP
jgi:hypothetical protein